MNQIMNSSEQFETVIISDDYDNSFNCSIIATVFSTLESEIEQAVNGDNA